MKAGYRHADTDQSEHKLFAALRDARNNSYLRLSIAGPFIIQPAINNVFGNITLKEFMAAFQKVHHPDGTVGLSLQTAMGAFFDSEQCCDFYVGEVRRYDGSEDIIRSAYADQTVKGNPLQFVNLEGGQLPILLRNSLPEPLNNPAGWDLPSDAGRQSLYMVYIMVVGFDGDMNLECH